MGKLHVLHALHVVHGTGNTGAQNYGSICYGALASKTECSLISIQGDESILGCGTHTQWELLRPGTECLQGQRPRTCKQASLSAVPTGARETAQ